VLEGCLALSRCFERHMSKAGNFQLSMRSSPQCPIELIPPEEGSRSACKVAADEQGNGQSKPVEYRQSVVAKAVVPVIECDE
jgi:hypothetical protein